MTKRLAKAVTLFKIDSKAVKYSGYFCRKICLQDLSKYSNLVTLALCIKFSHLFFVKLYFDVFEYQKSGLIRIEVDPYDQNSFELNELLKQ